MNLAYTAHYHYIVIRDSSVENLPILIVVVAASDLWDIAFVLPEFLFHGPCIP